jgi:hypothetical protein
MNVFDLAARVRVALAPRYFWSGVNILMEAECFQEFLVALSVLHDQFSFSIYG